MAKELKSRRVIKAYLRDIQVKEIEELFYDLLYTAIRSDDGLFCDGKNRANAMYLLKRTKEFMAAQYHLYSKK